MNDYLSDADTDVMLTLNGITVLNELSEDGNIVIRDDAEAGQVVIKFPFDHTPELRKRIRSSGFCTKGPRRAFRLRKVSGGVNSALEDARGLVREILGGD